MSLRPYLPQWYCRIGLAGLLGLTPAHALAAPRLYDLSAHVEGKPTLEEDRVVLPDTLDLECRWRLIGEWETRSTRGVCGKAQVSRARTDAVLVPDRAVYLGLFPGTGRIPKLRGTLSFPTLGATLNGASIPLKEREGELYIAAADMVPSVLRRIGASAYGDSVEVELTGIVAWEGRNSEEHTSFESRAGRFGADDVLRASCASLDDDTAGLVALGADAGVVSAAWGMLLDACPSSAAVYEAACGTLPGQVGTLPPSGWSARLAHCGEPRASARDGQLSTFVAQTIATVAANPSGSAIGDNLTDLHAHALRLGEFGAAKTLRTFAASPWVRPGAGPTLPLEDAERDNPSHPLFLGALAMSSDDAPLRRALESAWLARQERALIGRCSDADAVETEAKWVAAWISSTAAVSLSTDAARARARLGDHAAEVCVDRALATLSAPITAGANSISLPTETSNALRTLAGAAPKTVEARIRAAAGRREAVESPAFERWLLLSREPDIGGDWAVPALDGLITRRVERAEAQGPEATAAELTRFGAVLTEEQKRLPSLVRAAEKLQRRIAEMRAQRAKRYLHCVDAAVRERLSYSPDQADISGVAPNDSSLPFDNTIHEGMVVNAFFSAFAGYDVQNDVAFKGRVAALNGFGAKRVHGFGVAFPDVDVGPGKCPAPKAVWFCDNRDGCGPNEKYD